MKIHKPNLFLFSILILIFIVGCRQENQQQIQSNVAAASGKMKLASPAFQNNGPIPIEFTCDGADINPPLSISVLPENTKSLSLITEDPDAVVGVFNHWIVWNIPSGTNEIPKGSEPGTRGKTSSGKLGYTGPCPSRGTHRYFFRVYAMDTKLDLPEGSSKSDLQSAMSGHIIEQASLMGTYKKIK